MYNKFRIVFVLNGIKAVLPRLLDSEEDQCFYSPYFVNAHLRKQR